MGRAACGARIEMSVPAESLFKTEPFEEVIDERQRAQPLSAQKQARIYFLRGLHIGHTVANVSNRRKNVKQNVTPNRTNHPASPHADRGDPRRHLCRGLPLLGYSAGTSHAMRQAGMPLRYRP